MTEPRLSPSETKRPSAREPALDGLRGVAILLVYLYHYGGGLHSEHIGGRLFGYLTESGWTGVVLFFVLSGFLITAGLRGAEGQAHHRLRNFYARRALRILPLYYASLGLAFLSALAASARYDEMKPLLVYAAFLQNVPPFVPVANAAPPPLPLFHFWTLAVEEQFYLLWPALIFLARTPRARMRLCLLIFGGSAAFRIAIWNGHTSDLTRGTLAGSLPVHAGALALGAALALCLGSDRWLLLSRYAPAAMIAGLLGYGLAGARTGSLDLKAPLQVTLGLACVSVSAAALVVLALRTGLIKRALRMAPLRWLGRISYGVYVFHILLEPLFNAVGEHFAHLQYGPRYQALRFVVALPLSVVAAALSFALLESPFLELKARFPVLSAGTTRFGPTNVDL